MGTLWGREPVMVLAVLQAGIALAIAFGVELTNEQTGALVAFSAAVLGVITRSRVTPT